jgi:hypothetical protein
MTYPSVTKINTNIYKHSVAYTEKTMLLSTTSICGSDRFFLSKGSPRMCIIDNY